MDQPRAPHQEILDGVPQEADPNAFQPDEEGPPANITTNNHRRGRSTAHDLFSLTRDLEELRHFGGGTASSSSSVGDDDEKDRNKTDTEALMQGAAALFKRNRIGTETGVEKNDHARRLRINTDPGHMEMEGKFVKDSEANNASEASSDDNPAKREDDLASNEGYSRKSMFYRRAKNKVAANFRDFEEWLTSKKMSSYSYMKIVLFGLMIPMTAIAAILYYLAGNPPCGPDGKHCLQIEKILSNLDGTVTNSTLISGSQISQLFVSASISWWLLFFVRQLVTLTMAKMMQAFLVDYLALRSRWCVWLLGPFVTLFIVQVSCLEVSLL
jgi:hypothetical protein